MQQNLVQSMQDYQSNLQSETLSEVEHRRKQDKSYLELMQNTLTQLRTEAFYIISSLLQIKN